MDRVQVQYFSDVLCIWAYVSQARMDELREQFDDSVEIATHYLSVFGSAQEKIERQWADRGGAAGYAAHVAEVVSGFPHVELNPRAWREVVPRSSMPAHLLLCACRELSENGTADPLCEQDLAWAIRRAFFRDAIDISERRNLLAIAEREGVDPKAVESALDDGTAHARLAADLQQSREQDIRASPTLVFNEGRQRLTGNVGYRIIDANVRELLAQPSGQHSWC